MDSETDKTDIIGNTGKKKLPALKEKKDEHYCDLNSIHAGCPT